MRSGATASRDPRLCLPSEIMKLSSVRGQPRTVSFAFFAPSQKSAAACTPLPAITTVDKSRGKRRSPEFAMAIRILHPDLLHEVTQRTIGGAHVFDPNNKALTDALYGALAASLRRYDIKVVAFHFLSNHYHGLFQISSAANFVLFLAHFHAGIVRACHRALGSSGKLLGDTKCVPVATDDASTVQRLRYIMGQAVNAGIVFHPQQFPGASSLDWMLSGTELVGCSLDATARCRDKRRQAGPGPEESYVRRLPVAIVPPPCWAELEATEMRLRYGQIANEISEMARQRRAAQVEDVSTKIVIAMRQTEDGGPFMQGPVQPKFQDPDSFRGKMPVLLAANPEQIAEYAAQRREITAAYRRAKLRWLTRSRQTAAGLRSASVAIPANTVLGTMPFVPAARTGRQDGGRSSKKHNDSAEKTQPPVRAAAQPSPALQPTHRAASRRLKSDVSRP